MKNFSIFLLLALFSLGLYSCQEKEDLSPNQLEGVYEFREFIDSIGLWSVTTYNFRPEGTYQYSITMRESEGGKDLGYRRFLNATYQWDGQILSYQPENGHGLPFGSEELFRPKSQLESYEGYIFDYFRELKARVDFAQNRELMNYLEIYPESWDFTESTRTYVRVGK